MQKKFKRLIKESLLFLVLFVVVSLAVNIYRTWDLAEGSAPVLEAVTIDGQGVNLAQIDKPVLVHFWATWCPICKMEFSSINSIARDHAVITVAMNSGSLNELKRFVQQEGLEFPVIADEDGIEAQKWSVKGVPTSFIIMPDGKISFVEVGYTTEIGLRIRLWWAGI